MIITFEPIGVIHTPFKNIGGMPIQSAGAKGIEGKIILNKKFVKGLLDLDGFSHIILLYHFHKSEGYKLHTTTFLDEKIHGVFATRAPKRPNQIGISVVELLSINRNILHIKNVDMLDGTPLIDIKPYVSDFDLFRKIKKGWLKSKMKKLNNVKSDNRFK